MKNHFNNKLTSVHCRKCVGNTNQKWKNEEGRKRERENEKALSTVLNVHVPVEMNWITDTCLCLFSLCLYTHEVPTIITDTHLTSNDFRSFCRNSRCFIDFCTPLSARTFLIEAYFTDKITVFAWLKHVKQTVCSTQIPCWGRSWVCTRKNTKRTASSKPIKYSKYVA